LVAAGRLVTHRLYRQPSAASNKVSWAPGCDRSRRAKTRIASGQPDNWSPAGFLAQQRCRPGDLRCFDPAPAVPAAQVTAGLIGAPLADLSASVDRDLPGASRDGADCGAFPAAKFPADGVDDLAAGPGGQLIQPGDQGVGWPRRRRR
jgi:hypothetical protein